MANYGDLPFLEEDGIEAEPVSVLPRYYAIYRRGRVDSFQSDGDLYFKVEYRRVGNPVTMERAIQIADQIISDEFPRSAYHGELLVDVNAEGVTSRVNILHHSDERFGYGAQLPLVVLWLNPPMRTAAPLKREALKASYWRR